jgi:hypothetical protein
MKSEYSKLSICCDECTTIHKLTRISFLGKKQYSIRSLALLPTKINFFKTKMTKQNALEKLSKSWRAKEIFKIAKNWAFSNIKPKYFVIFFCFHPKCFFFELQAVVCSLKKN